MLRKRWLAGAISDRRFASAIDDLEALDVDRYPTLQLVRRSYELRANVTAYDAVYVALDVQAIWVRGAGGADGSRGERPTRRSTCQDSPSSSAT